MARRPSLIKKRQKKERGSRQITKSVNGKYLGRDEPFVAGKVLTEGEYARGLTWYNYMTFKEDWIDYVIEYLESSGRRDEALRFKSVPKSWILSSIGAWARALFLGVSPNMSVTKGRFEDKLKELLKHAGERDDQEGADEEGDETEGNPTKAQKPSVRDHLNEKASRIFGEIEGLYDDLFEGVVDFDDFDLTEWFRKQDVNPKLAKMIADKYRPWVETWDEIVDAPRGEENGYQHLSKDEKEGHREFYVMIVDGAERFGQNEKKLRAPRKKKPVSVEKKIRFLIDSYQKNSKEFNVVSVDPSKIIGAGELWTFNTKYKILTVFRGDGFGGTLDVNRCKIAGYDKNNSFSKRIGRKTEIWVDRCLKDNKTGLKKIMSEISGDPIKLAERVNENTILLRVF